MFSACSRLEVAGQRLPFVQYLVSLAVVQAVQAEAERRLQVRGRKRRPLAGRPLSCIPRLPASLLESGSVPSYQPATALHCTPLLSDTPAQGRRLGLGIKWPNDIYAGGFKLGGVLCHSAYRDGVFHITMGVGLNLSNRQPSTCVDALIAEAAAAAGQAPAPAPVQREELLAGVVARLEPMLARLAAEGFAPFEGAYYDAWLHSGQAVELEEGGGEGGAPPRRVSVVIRGLSPHGYLLAEDAAGERYELHPDGNSLDFFRGLVRRKVPAAA